MRGVNKIILVGNVGREPELRAIGSGHQVAAFSLATGRQWVDRQGQRQEKTEWHRVVAWDKQAELCATHVKKGEKLYIEGEITYREYEAEGLKRTMCEVRVLRLEFLGGRKAEPASHSAAGLRAKPAAGAPAPRSADGWGSDIDEEQIPF